MLKPNLESAANNRRIIRRFKQKRFIPSNSKQNAPVPVTAEPEDEIIRRIKEQQLRISTSIEHLSHYGPQYYKVEWNKYYRVLKQTANKDINPLNWTIDQVVENIHKICNSEDISSRFKEQEIDGGALLDLSKEDLNNLLSIKLGPSIKISHFIETLRNEVCQKFIVFENETNELEHLKH